MVRVRVGLALPALFLLVLCVHAAPDDPLGAELDSLLRPLSRGPGAEDAAERLRPFGEEAVVRLIARYETSDSDRRRVVPAVLCHLGGDRALAWVLALLRDRPGEPGVRDAIRAFPVDQEDRLLPLLIRHAHDPELDWWVRERLEAAIRREPARAGLLVAALDDDPEEQPRMRKLYEVLGEVAGYAGHWYVIVAVKPARSRNPTPVDHNGFWRSWWRRHRARRLVEWLDEPLGLGGGPACSAAQVLAHLQDPAAVPRLVRLLEDPQRAVRYWAVVGLKRREGTLPEAGYLSETFDAEEAVEIPRLKRAFGD